MDTNAQNTDCIFCKIVAGDIPAARIYQDDHVLAFVDINPLADGHVLVIPKRHYVTMDQMPPDEAAALARCLPRLAKAVQSAAGADGLNILQNNGSVAGQVVMHLHVHLIPRVPGDGLGYRWPAQQYPPGRLQQVCDMIKDMLGE